ncbi:hypothetical protein LP415_09815 [Polaromonas sp. P1(28)-8]|nr:hypothetical protein LP415_09815 [Polaromonas sp. P1(28)-8]
MAWYSAFGLDGAPYEAVNADQGVLVALVRRPDKAVRLVDEKANHRGAVRDFKRRNHRGLHGINEGRFFFA